VALDQYQKRKEEGGMFPFWRSLESIRWHLCFVPWSAILIFTVMGFVARALLFGISEFCGPIKSRFCLRIVGSVVSVNLPREFLLSGSMSCHYHPERQMSGQFPWHVTSKFVVRFPLLPFPYVFWEVWNHPVPGLYDKGEKCSKRSRIFCKYASSFYGSCFGYFILSPLSINF